LVPISVFLWEINMRRIFGGSVAIASLLAAASAFAADLPARTYTKAPVMVDPGYNWTGFYAGVNIGYSWGRSASTLSFVDTVSGAILNSNAVKFDLNGVIGGGQIGYNWQKSNWVFGLEADIQGSGQKGNGNAVCPGGVLTPRAAVTSTCAPGHIGDTTPFDVAAFPVTDNLSQKLEWFGTVRGRIGPTITPTILAYVTGGLAYGQVSTTGTVGGTNIFGANGTNTFTLVPVTGSFSNSSTRVGWTVGGGIEGVVSGNWTAKIEYLYIDLGTVSGSFVTPIVAPGGAFVTTRYSSHITDNILRVGVNYKWGGPVVAKY
jgi:outer membrane immunogenic protein